MRPEKSNPRFSTEVELCAAFISAAGDKWTAYAETGGFDIVLVRKSDGLQIGIEAKLDFNPHVLSQALPSRYDFTVYGPDCRAVLVPMGKPHLGSIAAALGITVIAMGPEVDGRYVRGPKFSPGLPDERFEWAHSNWHEWAPAERIRLPDYIPDVSAGASAPLALTSWKIAAIKMAVLLESRPVSRLDFKELKISPTRWTDPYTGWLRKTDKGFVAGTGMPDFRAQHPRNYEEIKADIAKWSPKHADLLARAG